MAKDFKEWLTNGGPLKCAGCGRHVPLYFVWDHSSYYGISRKHPNGGIHEEAELIGDSIDDHFYCKRCIDKTEINEMKVSQKEMMK